MTDLIDGLAATTPLDIRLGLRKVEDKTFALRWGILGAGNISSQWVHSLRSCKGASITAVAAREAGKAQAFAAEHDIPTAYANVVAPGFIDTQMTADLVGAARKQLTDRIPLGRLGSPEDVAPIIRFLAGPGACYITGQVIVVDGGIVM